MNNDENSLSLGKFGEKLEQIRGQLRDGGPPVEWDAIYLFAGGDLDDDPDAKKLIAGRIATWRQWFEAYWETKMGLGRSGDEDASND